MKPVTLSRLFLLMLPALMVSLGACRSSKSTTAVPSGTNDSGWNCVYLPVKVSLDKPASFSLSGRATIERGRAMHVSMRFLGMEVAWMTLTNDSIFVVDKFHKYAFAEPLASVLGSRAANLTLDDITQISFGRKPLTGNETVTLTTEQFVPTPAGDAARRVVILSETEHGDFGGTLEWDFDGASWNNPSRTVPTPKIPKGYKRIDPGSLQNALKNLKM